MQPDKDYIPVPVAYAAAISKTHNKDIVIIISFEHGRALVQTTTFGKAERDRKIASELGLAITKFVGGDVERKTVFEDPEGLMGEKV